MRTHAASRSAACIQACRTFRISPFLPVAVAAVVVATAACASVHTRDQPVAGYSPLERENASAGLVLSGPDLQEHDGNLLDFLTSRVSGLSVDDTAFPCPSMDLRGRKSLIGPSNPGIYVDGVRAANTCVLTMMSTRAVKRVEVYPMGVSSRPGYKNHPNGLILIFMDAGGMRDG